MADSVNEEGEPTIVENAEFPEASEPQNIDDPTVSEAVGPAETEPPNSDLKPEEKKQISSKSSEKLATEPHAVTEEVPQDNKDTEEQPTEEYKEEVKNDDESTTIIEKVQPKKEPSSSSVKLEPVDSYIEKEEEYEEEEIDDSGVKLMVKKKRTVRIQREPKIEVDLSYDEIEEEYEEEETDESGQTTLVRKKRFIKVPKIIESVEDKDSKELRTSEKDDTSKKEDENEEGKEDEKDEDDDVREEIVDEDEFEDVEEEEEEDEGEEENIIEDIKDGQESSEHKMVKASKKKKIKKEIDGDEQSEGEAEQVKKEKKRRRRRKKPKELEQKTSKSEISKEDEKEEVEEVKSTDEEEEGKTDIVSKSSVDLRQEEERAAIGAQFEILMKLRSEYITIRKRLFFLNNKLILYFKKQKMEHVFAEAKDDPEAELKYLRKLNNFYEINQHYMEEKLKINSEWEAQRSLNEELAEKLKQELDNLMAKKREVASKLIDPRTGRTISHDKTIEDLLVREENLLKQLSECRLTQIKLKRKIESKKEERKMDHMGADFNLMDYEKLSSLKEYYMDKITERDIEIGEVTQKLNITEDKLRNVKDDLREKQEEMVTHQQRLQRISSDLHKKRADLNRVKATRHKTEKNTAKMKQQSGLLSYPNLLKDYDEKNEQVIELTEEIEKLKYSFRHHKSRILQLQEMAKRKSLAKFSLKTPSPNM